MPYLFNGNRKFTVVKRYNLVLCWHRNQRFFAGWRRSTQQRRNWPVRYFLLKSRAWQRCEIGFVALTRWFCWLFGINGTNHGDVLVETALVPGSGRTFYLYALYNNPGSISSPQFILHGIFQFLNLLLDADFDFIFQTDFSKMRAYRGPLRASTPCTRPVIINFCRFWSFGTCLILCWRGLYAARRFWSTDKSARYVNEELRTSSILRPPFSSGTGTITRCRLTYLGSVSRLPRMRSMEQKNTWQFCQSLASLTMVMQTLQSDSLIYHSRQRTLISIQIRILLSLLMMLHSPFQQKSSFLLLRKITLWQRCL